MHILITLWANVGYLLLGALIYMPIIALGMWITGAWTRESGYD